jgi:hypothetical protein
VLNTYTYIHHQPFPAPDLAEELRWPPLNSKAIAEAGQRVRVGYPKRRRRQHFGYHTSENNYEIMSAPLLKSFLKLTGARAAPLPKPATKVAEGYGWGMWEPS